MGHELREELKSNIQGELNHAVFLADKIVVLGGELMINPKMARTAKQMTLTDIAAERRVVANYAKRIDQASAYGDRGLVIRVEDMLAEENDHAESLELLGR